LRTLKRRLDIIMAMNLDFSNDAKIRWALQL
jgi:hypothetical protein